MVDSISGVANLATALKQQENAQQVETAVLSKTQAIQQQQGEAVLELVQAAELPAENIDVYV